VARKLGNFGALAPNLKSRNVSGLTHTSKLDREIWAEFDADWNAYETTCCVTGIALPQCLIASHIVPWSVEEDTRTDPTNGLCLSATFDRLFDAGLMTVTVDLAVRFSTRLLKSSQLLVRDLICVYNGRPIKRPHRFLPAGAYLKWHHEHRFIT